MKKAIYYSALFILWMIIHVLFAAIMLVTGVLDGPFPSISLALIVAVIIPEYWIVSIGLTLFARDMLSRKILGEEKKHSKVIPTILVAIGGIMVIAGILLKIFLG